MMRLILAAFLFVLLSVIAPGAALCEPPEGAAAWEVPEGYSHLLTISPPVAGYTSVDGVIYNLLPFGVEVPVHKRMGISLNTGLSYYDDDFQHIALLARLMIYSRASSEAGPYRGFYAAPMVWGGYDLHGEGTLSTAGVSAGYVLQGADSPWRLMFGLWYLDDSKDEDLGHGGISLELGHWY
jgi:hypothetical protein